MTHLDPAIIAAYVERVISGDERARVDAHLAECDECRREVVAVSDLVHRARTPAWRSARVIIPLAAAAGLLLVLSPWRVIRDIDPAHREPAVIASQPPTVRAPMGPVVEAPSVIWSEVRGANRYRVTLYDSTGRVLWEAATTDTLVALPDSLALRHDARYFWRVHARTGFDRWTESNLVEFRLMDRR